MSDIKSYSFLSLEGAEHVISKELTPTEFNFQPLEEIKVSAITTSQSVIRNERDAIKDKGFLLDSLVKNARGHAKQEEQDFEDRVRQEVEKRILVLKEQIYAEGIEKGRIDAFEKHDQELVEKIAQIADQFAQQAEQTSKQFQEIIDNNNERIYNFVKRFCQWICLKEISDDSYLLKLSEKLLLEIKERNNLLIKIDAAHFSDFPDLVKKLEEKFGAFTNLRIEPESNLNYPGIIIESENSIIDGSFEGVLANIERIFQGQLSDES